MNKILIALVVLFASCDGAINMMEPLAVDDGSGLEVNRDPCSSDDDCSATSFCAVLLEQSEEDGVVAMACLPGCYVEEDFDSCQRFDDRGLVCNTTFYTCKRIGFMN